MNKKKSEAPGSPAKVSKKETPQSAPKQSDKKQLPQLKTVRWEAQEYIVRDKNAGWFVGLVIIGLALVALAIWWQQWSLVLLVVVSVVALILYAVRPPRVLHYELGAEGLKEENREYKYENYKAFGVMNENQHFSIVLVPKKRFSLKVTVYFPEASGEEIVDLFGAHLPMEEIKPDIFDNIARWLRI